MDQDATWYEVDLGAYATLCSMWTQLPPEKRAHPLPPNFVADVYCGQMAGWMKTLLGAEVDLGSGHIVLNGVPSPAKGTQHPLFSAHVYCDHGRPSQLLLSSCKMCPT